MNTLCLHHPDKVTFAYQIPDHLKGITDVSELRQADLELLKEELRSNGSSLEEKIGQKTIWRMNFPGMVLDAKELSSEQGAIQIKVAPIHPYRADLTFKRDRTLEKRCPITVNSILMDEEYGVIMAVRSDDGFLGVIPGGHAEYNPENPETNPFQHLLIEFEEELGFEHPKAGEKTPIVCLHDNKDTFGINLLYSTAVKKSFGEIQALWERAKDRYEHNTLVKVPSESLLKLAETRAIDLDGKPYHTTPFFRDCIQYHLENQGFILS